MATLKACVRRQRKDGFWPVYIRVTHHREATFIKTDKMVTGKQVTKTKAIKDPFVIKYCSELIIRYNEQLNTKDISTWDVFEVAEFLQNENADINFSEYAKLHIQRMKGKGQLRNAKNYELAVRSLELNMGTTQIMFSHLTSSAINKWIEDLASTKRAKQMYPVCVRQIFKAALKEYNDYDQGLIRIKTNPWMKVEIHSANLASKRAISPEACREFFAAPLPLSKMAEPLPEFGNAVIKEFLDNLAKVNELFAKKYQKTKMKLDDITTNVLNQVKNSGCCGFEDSEIYGMVLHCIVEPDLDIGKPIQCQIVVNRQMQLSDNEKAEQKALALKRFQDEEYRKLEQRNKPKVKLQVEKQPHASLFDEF